MRSKLSWRDVSLPSDRIFGTIHPEEGPSLRLAENMGFHLNQTASHTGQEQQVLMQDLWLRPSSAFHENIGTSHPFALPPST